MTYRLPSYSFKMTDLNPPMTVTYSSDSGALPQELKSRYPNRFYNDLSQLQSHFLSSECNLREQVVFQNVQRSVSQYKKYFANLTETLNKMTGEEQGFVLIVKQFLQALSSQILDWEMNLYKQFLSEQENTKSPISEKAFVISLIIAFITYQRESSQAGRSAPLTHDYSFHSIDINGPTEATRLVSLEHEQISVSKLGAALCISLFILGGVLSTLLYLGYF